MGLFKRSENLGKIEIFPINADDWTINSSMSIRLTSMALIHYFERVLRNPYIKVSERYLHEVGMKMAEENFDKKASSKNHEVWINYANKIHDFFEEATTAMFSQLQWNHKFKAVLKLFKYERKDFPLNYWYFVQSNQSFLSNDEEWMSHRFYSFMTLYNYCYSFGDEICRDFIAISFAHMLKWFNEDGVPRWNRLTIAGNMAILNYFRYKAISNEAVKQNFEKYLQDKKIELYWLRV